MYADISLNACRPHRTQEEMRTRKEAYAYGDILSLTAFLQAVQLITRQVPERTFVETTTVKLNSLYLTAKQSF